MADAHMQSIIIIVLDVHSTLYNFLFLESLSYLDHMLYTLVNPSPRVLYVSCIISDNIAIFCDGVSNLREEFVVFEVVELYSVGEIVG